MFMKRIICWLFGHKLKRIGKKRIIKKGSFTNIHPISRVITFELFLLDRIEMDFKCERCGKIHTDQKFVY